MCRCLSEAKPDAKLDSQLDAAIEPASLHQDVRHTLSAVRIRFPGCLVVARIRCTRGRLHRLVAILVNVLAEQRSVNGLEPCQTAVANLLDKEGLAPLDSMNSRGFQHYDKVSAFISSTAGSTFLWT